MDSEKKQLFSLGNVENILTEFQTKIKDLKSLFGKKLLFIDKANDFILTPIDIIVGALIIGSIFFKTIQNLWISGLIGLVLSVVLNVSFQLVMKTVAMSFACGLWRKKNDRAEGYPLLTWTFAILGIVMFVGLVKIAYKTDNVVEVFGKKELKKEKTNTNLIVDKFDLRRLNSDSFYLKRIAVLDAEISSIDTEDAYRNDRGQILTYWVKEKLSKNKERARLETEKRNEKERIDKLEQLALANANNQNDVKDFEFKGDFEESGDFANGANLGLTSLRVIFMLVFAIFADKAIAEDDKIKKAAEQKQELIDKEREMKEEEEKRLHDARLFDLELKRKEAQAKADAIRIEAEGKAAAAAKAVELEGLAKVKAAELKASELEIKKLEKMKELQAIQAANKIKEEQMAKEVTANANNNGYSNSANANNFFFRNANRKTPTRENLPTNRKSANIKVPTSRPSANSKVPTPTPTVASLVRSNVGSVGKTANANKPPSKRQQKPNSANKNIKAITRAMKVKYQDNGKGKEVVGVVIDGVWKTRKQITSTLASNRERADSSTTAANNVEIYSAAVLMLNSEKDKLKGA